MKTENANHDLVIAIVSLINILLFLYFVETGHAELSVDQQARNNTENYVSVEFNQAPLEDLLFFVAEMTGQAFVLNAKDVTLSWVQKDIYKDDLVTEFINVVIASGLTTLRSGSSDQVIIITDNTNAAANVQSITKLDGGKKLYLSEINDDTGRYIVFLGIIYKASEFPFPIIESPLGPMAIVPQDVYQADEHYKSQIAQLTISNQPDSFPSPEREDSVQ